MSIVFEQGWVRVAWKDKTAMLASHVEDDETIIDLDQWTHWLAPHEEVEVTLDDLMAITQMIEAEADRRGIAIAFA